MNRELTTKVILTLIFDNPPFTVEIEEFVFNISDKSGVGETRNPHLSIETIKKDLLENKDNQIDIKNGKVERIT